MTAGQQPQIRSHPLTHSPTHPGPPLHPLTHSQAAPGDALGPFAPACGCLDWLHDGWGGNPITVPGLPVRCVPNSGTPTNECFTCSHLQWCGTLPPPPLTTSRHPLEHPGPAAPMQLRSSAGRGCLPSCSRGAPPLCGATTSSRPCVSRFDATAPCSSRWVACAAMRLWGLDGRLLHVATAHAKTAILHAGHPPSASLGTCARAWPCRRTWWVAARMRLPLGCGHPGRCTHVRAQR
jgi:hypothetical protein